MRERITAPVSKYFSEAIILPETLKDFATIFHEALAVQRAYAVMLTKRGLIEPSDGKSILQGLAYVETTLTAENIQGEYEDLYYNIEKVLVEQTGVKVGGKLHMGRSRNDIGSTLNRIQVRKTILSIMAQLLEFQGLLLEKAEANLDTVITGYTHMQPAQPITLGHYYTAIFFALERDFTRLLAAYRNTNLCPYGAAAFAGASFPIDRRMLAELLSFDGILQNSLDCIASKDFLLETEMAFANLAITISRLAQDHYIWSTHEFGLLDVGGQVAVCSSIMPQKKNPAGLEYAKGKASHIIGALMSTLAALKNIPFSNNIDIHEALWFYDEGFRETSKALGILAETLRYSEINKEHALAQAKENFSTVTGLADELVRSHGLSFEEGHKVVGNMVLAVLDDGSGMRGLNRALLKAESQKSLGYEIDMPDEDIAFVLDPLNNVEMKVTIGGPSSASVKEMLADAHQKLAHETDLLAGLESGLEKGTRLLAAEIERILTS